VADQDVAGNLPAVAARTALRVQTPAAMFEASRTDEIEVSDHPMMNTVQKVAIITGAPRGIGAALVTAYRQLGCAVVATSRSIGESSDPEVLTVRGDVTEPGVGARTIDAALARFGRVDTLVNDAGVFITKPFTDYTDEDYDAVAGVNLRGFFQISAARSPRCSAGTAAVTLGALKP
jgi:NAD(P)-dependent dehydrogenase (short-subunit alcohol dehydrogenase family)